MATAPILPLAWEPPNAVDATLKRQKTKKNMCVCEVPIVAHGYLTSTHEDTGLIPGFLSGLRIWCFRELWCRSQTLPGFGIAVAVVTALIQPLGWEPP